MSVSHPLAAEAGELVLEAGGNAIDAAAAIQFALNVVEPQYSGIGGGAFLLVHVARTGETFVVDARERAPAAATPDMFLFAAVPAGRRFEVASTSGTSVGVPGTLLGFDVALRRWGTIPLERALAPAIELAERGFPVNRFLAADIVADLGRTTLQPETAALFRPGGEPLREGALLRQPDLARTLRLIATQGTEVFYRGEIARAIVEAQHRSRTPTPAEGRGRMTLADLAGYDAKVRAPLVGRYRGTEVVTVPPPSSGGLVLLQALGMLERFPLADESRGFGFGSVASLHVTIESLRLGFADRALWMGDADFVPVPVEGLLSSRYLAARSALIDPHRRMATPAAGDPRPRQQGRAADDVRLARAVAADEGGHTTHFTVADRWGNVVAVTSSIEMVWGSGITVPGYGFLLNNQLTDFNLVPQASADPARFDPGANDVAGGKRPRSAMAPTLLFRDGKPVAGYGSPGGPTIIGTVLQMTQNLVDYGMPMQTAIDVPRIAVTSAAGSLRCEGPDAFLDPRFGIDMQDALRSLGHEGLGPAGTDACTATIGSVQGVLLDPVRGRLYGGADQRREGVVLGLPSPR